MTAIDRFRRWFQYEKESHTQVLESLKTVPEAARESPRFQQAVSLAGHLGAARALWLHRLTGRGLAPDTFFPSTNLDEVRRDLEVIQRGWDAYLLSLSDLDLEGHFEYQSTEGGFYRSRIEDVLTQLFGHSLYHRGQIALLVRALGGKPAETDFVFWSRERIGKLEQEIQGANRD